MTIVMLLCARPQPRPKKYLTIKFRKFAAFPAERQKPPKTRLFSLPDATRIGKGKNPTQRPRFWFSRSQGIL